MYFTVYKTTNLINGKYYIGAHKTEDINDSYLGSGVALCKAIQKYGRENFQKEILSITDTPEKMFLEEQKLIAYSLGKEECYNMMPGGFGGFDHINSSGMHLGKNNPMHNPVTKAKVISSTKVTKNADKEKYDAIARNNLKYAMEKIIGVKRPHQSEPMRNWAKAYWRDNKESMRDALSSHFQLTDPTGLVYNTNRLQDFCEEHNLTYVSVWCSTKTGKPVTKGKAKGWLCKKI